MQINKNGEKSDEYLRKSFDSYFKNMPKHRFSEFSNAIFNIKIQEDLKNKE